jgi:hypothetical protein
MEASVTRQAIFSAAVVMQHIALCCIAARKLPPRVSSGHTAEERD